MKHLKFPKSTNKNISSFGNYRSIHTVFLVLVIMGIALRISLLPTLYAVNDGDTARDYVIARHIAIYHEYPLIGPNNAIYDAVRASPLYYYLLAIPVSIHDSVYSIGIANVVLQALSIISLYLLAFTIFGQMTASLTAILLIFNQELFSQSFYMIQAHFGHLFFNSSYFFLAYGYTHYSRRATIVSAILFALGCTVAFHGFPALLGYLIILILVLKSQKNSFIQITKMLGLMSAIGIFFYAPMLSHMIQSGNALFLINEPVYIRTLSNFPIRIIENIRLAMDDWVRALWFSTTIKNIILGFFSLILLHTFVTQKKNITLPIITILLYIVQIGFLAACLHIGTNSYQYDAATGLTIILLAFIGTRAWPHTTLGRVGSIITICCLILLVAPTRGYIQWKQSELHQAEKLENKLAPLYTYMDQLHISSPTSWNHFQIEMHNGQANMYHWKESVIWNALEHRYDTRLLHVTNNGYNYAPLEKSDDHYILLCEEYKSLDDAIKRCVSSFRNAHNDLRFATTLISDQSPSGYVIFNEERVR